MCWLLAPAPPDYAVEHFGKRSHARLALTTPARRTSPGLAAVEAPRRGQGVSSPVATTDNDRSALGLAARIACVKSATSIGADTGRWLSLKQARVLLNAQGISPLKGLRHRGLRTGERFQSLRRRTHTGGAG
jgi:hypothetical protein